MWLRRNITDRDFPQNNNENINRLSTEKYFHDIIIFLFIVEYLPNKNTNIN